MKKIAKKRATIGTDAGIHHRLFAKLMKNTKAQKAYNAEDTGKSGINREVFKTLFDDVKDTPEFKKGYQKELLKFRGKIHKAEQSRLSRNQTVSLSKAKIMLNLKNKYKKKVQIFPKRIS